MILLSWLMALVLLDSSFDFRLAFSLLMVPWLIKEGLEGLRGGCGCD